MITNSQSCAPLGQCHVPWHITSIHFSWTIFPQTHKREPARRLHHPSDLSRITDPDPDHPNGMPSFFPEVTPFNGFFAEGLPEMGILIRI